MSNSTKRTASRMASVASRFGFELTVFWAFILVFGVISRVDTSLENIGFGLLELMSLAGVSMWVIHYVASWVRSEFIHSEFEVGISSRYGPENSVARFVAVFVPLTLLSAISMSTSVLALQLVTSETGGFGPTAENLTFLMILAVIVSWLPAIAATVAWEKMEEDDD